MGQGMVQFTAVQSTAVQFTKSQRLICMCIAGSVSVTRTYRAGRQGSAKPPALTRGRCTPESQPTSSSHLCQAPQRTPVCAARPANQLGDPACCPSHPAGDVATSWLPLYTGLELLPLLTAKCPMQRCCLGPIALVADHRVVLQAGEARDGDPNTLARGRQAALNSMAPPTDLDEDRDEGKFQTHVLL